MSKEAYQADIAKKANQKSVDLLTDRVYNLSETMERDIKNMLIGTDLGYPQYKFILRCVCLKLTLHAL